MEIYGLSTSELILLGSVAVAALALYEQRRGNNLNAAAIKEQTEVVREGNQIMAAGLPKGAAMPSSLRSIQLVGSPQTPSRWPFIALIALLVANAAVTAVDHFSPARPNSPVPLSDTADVPSNAIELNVPVEMTSPYEVAAKPSWNTDIWVTERQDHWFTLAFDASAPPMGATVDWTVIPLPNVARLAPELGKRDAHLRALLINEPKLTNALKAATTQNAEAQSRIASLTTANASLSSQLDAASNYRRHVAAGIKDIKDHQLSSISDQIIKTAGSTWFSAAQERVRAEQKYNDAKAASDALNEGLKECQKLGGLPPSKGCPSTTAQFRAQEEMLGDGMLLGQARTKEGRAAVEMTTLRCRVHWMHYKMAILCELFRPKRQFQLFRFRWRRLVR